MIKSIDTLFGNSLEVKILTTIIPLGAGAKVTTAKVMKATGANEKRVSSALNKFREFGLLIVSTHQSSETQAPADWHYWEIKESNLYVALYRLIHAAYDDELRKNAMEAMK